MNWPKLLGQALLAFVGSHLDELVIFVAQFARVISHSKHIEDEDETRPLTHNNPPLRAYHVIIGQLLGFTLTIILSVLGYFIGVIINREWIGLLGFIPIIVGLKELIGECKKLFAKKEKKDGLIQDVETTPEEKDEQRFKKFEKKVQKKWIKNANHILQVTLVGFASGTDSIGVFLPLFASATWLASCLFVALFYVLFILWMVLAYLLINQKYIALAIKKYGEYVGAVLLIGLGVYVIIDCESYKLLTNKL